MADVYIGEGSLAGRGVNAGRAFCEGEVVVPYRLRQLTRDQYLALSESEKLAVHSYFGERFLYPSPARYVNHSDTPNMFQDFERQCDVARRPIAAGELVTIDATEETDRELSTFLEVYEAAIYCCDLPKLSQLIDDQAVSWWNGPEPKTKDQTIHALREVSAHEGHGWRVALRDVRWMIGTGRWDAVCSSEFGVQPVSAATEELVRGHLTAVLKIIDGNWQIIYQHASAPGER